jgi:hypothetical protein
MKNSVLATLSASVLAIGALLVYSACSSDDTVNEATADAGSSSSGGTSGTTVNPDGGTLPDGAPADCVQNPQTYLDILNACTDATRIQKNPTLDKLLSDGGLPPLN